MDTNYELRTTKITLISMLFGIFFFSSCQKDSIVTTETSSTIYGLQADEVPQAADDNTEENCECFVSFSEPLDPNLLVGAAFTIGDVTGLSEPDAMIPGVSLIPGVSGTTIYSGFFPRSFPIVTSGIPSSFPNQSSFSITQGNLHYDLFGNSVSCFEVSMYGNLDIGTILNVPIRIECYLDGILENTYNEEIKFTIDSPGINTKEICLNNGGCINNTEM